MKRLSCKIGEYEKDGQVKGEYVKVGVLMDSGNGQYILFEPSFNPAGALIKQNALNVNKGQQARDTLMVSVFDDSNQSQQQGFQPQQQGYQQQPSNQQAPQQNPPF